MAEFPALPLWTDAYLGDTTHLTTFEHGAYFLLLVVSWRSPGCRVPDDDAMLARFTRTTPDKWRKLRPILQPFFRVRDGFWHQARLQDELQHLQSRRTQQIEAGQASAKAKALKRGNRGSTDVDPTLQRNVNETSTPIPTPIPMVEDTTYPLPIEDDTSSLSTLQPTHVVEAWNGMAERFKLPAVRGKLNDTRKRKVSARIKEHPLEDWLEALSAIERSAFLRGENQSGWTATFDWMIEPRNFTKLIEGNYDRGR